MRWKNYYANWKKPYVKGRTVYNPMHIQNRQIVLTESRCAGVHSAEVSGEQALMGQALPGSEENALWGWEHFVNVWKGVNWVLSILQINALLNNLQPGFCRKKKRYVGSQNFWNLRSNLCIPWRECYSSTRPWTSAGLGTRNAPWRLTYTVLCWSLLEELSFQQEHSISLILTLDTIKGQGVQFHFPGM